jgi:hypothetical protein
MFEEMIGVLEDMLEEIDSLVEAVSVIEYESELEPQFLEWSKNGSILDGGRSIRIGEEVKNVYDVLAELASKSTGSRTDS